MQATMFKKLNVLISIFAEKQQFISFSNVDGQIWLFFKNWELNLTEEGQFDKNINIKS